MAMKYSVIYTFNTDQDNKTLTQSFSDYNKDVTDDTLREVGSTLAAQQILYDSKNGVAASVKTIKREAKEITDVAVEPE